MPAHGLQWLSRKELLSYEEMLRICSLLIEMGIKKIRLTGGEPFVRKDLLGFIEQLVQLRGLEQVTLTTNGVLTAPLIPRLKSLGIQAINLSLDTLDRNRFFAISRRDELPAVLLTLEAALQQQMEVKVNAVVMEGKNTEDIASLAALTKHLPISVRFIEEMPFNGSAQAYSGDTWDYRRILAVIKEQFPGLQKIADPPYSTSLNYKVQGHKGTIGVIPAYTRSFCGTCNRIRLTADGNLKTCLYAGEGLSIKDLLRMGYSNEQLQEALQDALQQKALNGWEAERISHSAHLPSMATLGG
jgi:cyclic pyranopterin phosphate synthase